MFYRNSDQIINIVFGRVSAILTSCECKMQEHLSLFLCENSRQALKSTLQIYGISHFVRLGRLYFGNIVP
jgi:hypothetical protein